MTVSEANNSIRLNVVLGLAVIFVLSGSVSSSAQTTAQRVALHQLASTAKNSSQPQAAQVVDAADTSLAHPSSAAYDSTGNLYIADTNNHAIREVTPLGIITTVAGSGEQGFGGDGGPAVSAMLDSPAGLAVDASGNLYIADTHNQRIRRVASGTITTIAGTGTAGFSGDGGPATSATLNLPTALAIDSAGNIYIADTNNHRIRKITGATITTVAGDGDQSYSGDGAAATQAGLDSPNGIAVDAAGNLYIGDTHNQRVRMVSVATGLISTVAGTGAAGFSGDGAGGASATLARPRGVGTSAAGNLFIADSDNNRVRSINPGGTISTVAGDGEQGFAGDTGPATSALFNTPRAVAVNAANSVAVADTGNQRVRELRVLNSETLAGVGNPGSFALLLSAPSSVLVGNGTLTATLSNGPAGATGTVTFFDVTNGTAVAGTAALANNSSTLSLAGLSAGTHLFAASYQSNTNVPAVTSGVVGVDVLSNDFTISAAPSTLTVLPGDTANFTITLVAGSSSFGSTVALSVSGIPAGGTAIFNPVSIPAGAPQTSTSALTIQTAAQVAQENNPLNPFRVPAALGLVWLPLCVIRRQHGRSGKHRVAIRLFSSCLLLAAISSLSGCGSGVNPNAHPPKSYTITVTGSSAAVGSAPAISHSTMVTLTVE